MFWPISRARCLWLSPVACWLLACSGSDASGGASGGHAAGEAGGGSAGMVATGASGNAGSAAVGASGGSAMAGQSSTAAGGAGENGGASSSAGGAGAGLGGTPASGGVSAGGASAGGGSAGAGASGGGSGGTGANACASGGPSAHYVDSASGSDSADGSSPAKAWKTLTPVNAATFHPGDALCFHAGGTWAGQLAPKGSGSAAQPIVLGQYGTGNRPKIAAGAADLQALLLMNVAYWEVNDLELTNHQTAPGDLRGISVRGKDAGVLEHIYIRNCFVHDVTGVVNWIGGSTADNQAPWVTFQAGWDASKRTGGIVVEVESANGTKTHFNDVRIENNVVQDTSFGGIVFKQLDGGYGWGVRASRTDSKFLPHTNIVIRNNYISQTNTKYGCNAIYLTGSQHVTIERNVCRDAGTSAIEAYNADDVKIQYNETFGTVRKAGGADYNGIDTDRATTGAVVQYNYVHDNGDGILLCQFAFGDSVVRYNLVLNNSRYAMNLHSDSTATNQTYNNLLLLQGLSSGDLINSSGGSTYFASPYTFTNNILSSTRTSSVVGTGSGTSYANNLFNGVGSVGSGARTGNPLFVDASSHPNGTMSGPALSGLSGFQVQAGSPALEHGATVANNGGQDFWGNPLYRGAPDIGPFEKP